MRATIKFNNISSVTYLIAEIGVNHNGCLDQALKLIDCAHSANADAVKFQCFVPELMILNGTRKAEYQIDESDCLEDQKSMLSRLALTRQDHCKLSEYSSSLGIDYICSPFDLDSLDFLIKLGLPYIKVPSGEITNYPLINNLPTSNTKILLSTGMSTLGEVEASVNLLFTNGLTAQDLTLLHCTSQYPAPFAEINLGAMNLLGSAFGTRVGYSDHTSGISIALAAIALGASCIEKHLTLGHNLEGPDHQASLEPHEFAMLVTSARQVELSLRSSNKLCQPCESDNKMLVRKSIVASREIQIGEPFSFFNLTTKRPAHGMSPMMFPNLINKLSSKHYMPDDLISE